MAALLLLNLLTEHLRHCGHDAYFRIFSTILANGFTCGGHGFKVHGRVTNFAPIISVYPGEKETGTSCDIVPSSEHFTVARSITSAFADVQPAANSTNAAAICFFMDFLLMLDIWLSTQGKLHYFNRFA